MRSSTRRACRPLRQNLTAGWGGYRRGYIAINRLAVCRARAVGSCASGAGVGLCARLMLCGLLAVCRWCCAAVVWWLACWRSCGGWRRLALWLLCIGCVFAARCLPSLCGGCYVPPRLLRAPARTRTPTSAHPCRLPLSPASAPPSPPPAAMAHRAAKKTPPRLAPRGFTARGVIIGKLCLYSPL